jgi:hypothetical protein
MGLSFVCFCVGFVEGGEVEKQNNDMHSATNR